MHPSSPATAQKQAVARQFRAAAEKVSAVVSEVAGLEQALAYTVALCVRKEACELLAAGCGEPLSPAAETLCCSRKSNPKARSG